MPVSPNLARRSSSVWKIWLPIPLVLLLLDATFNLYFWRLPKLSGPDGDWGYQFLIDVQRAAAPKPQGTRRVVAFGSSVSVSFDPWQVSGLLAAHGSADVPVEVHRLMLPGVHPADYRLFWEGEAERIRPDVVVVMVNLLDFLSSSDPRDMNPTLLAALPPWQFLAERGADLSTTEQLDWAARGLSRLYRYSKAARSSLQDHLRYAAQSLRPRRPRPYGIYADGFTKPRFGVPVEAGKAVDFEYFLAPAWIAQRGVVQLSFRAGGDELRTVREVEAGWKRVSLEIPSANAELLEVAADGFWNARAAGEGNDVRLLGVGLRQVPPGELDKNPVPLRYPPHAPMEVHELLRMAGTTGDEFQRRWEAMINAPNEFGRRLRAAREDKLGIHQRTFTVAKEYSELETMVRNLSQSGASVVILNTPESPWLLDGYQNAEYYQRYLEFLARLAQQNDRAVFVDMRDALPVEDFNDWHHPNYIGSIKLGTKYAATVQAALKSSPPR